MPEDQLEEYNRKRNEEDRKVRIQQPDEGENEGGYDKQAFQETLLQKARGSVPMPEPETEPEEQNPNLKEAPIANVEKNAEDWQTKKQPIMTDQRNANIQKQPEKPKEQKPADPYKEAIE